MEILLTSIAFVVAARLRGPDGLRDPARRDVHGRRDGRGRAQAAGVNRLEHGRGVAVGRRRSRDRRDARICWARCRRATRLTYVTVLGGVLLGLGAYVNGACVFGAIARLGSGEWAYVVTPIGFYVGSLIVAYGFSPPARATLPYGSPVLVAALWLVLPFMAFQPALAAHPAFVCNAVRGIQRTRLGAPSQRIQKSFIMSSI